jgi:hypothetical protein
MWRNNPRKLLNRIKENRDTNRNVLPLLLSSKEIPTLTLLKSGYKGILSVAQAV